jgi:hypothetical protein
MFHQNNMISQLLLMSVRLRQPVMTLNLISTSLSRHFNLF